MHRRDRDRLMAHLRLMEVKQELFATLTVAMFSRLRASPQADVVPSLNELRSMIMAVQQEIDRLSANVEGLTTEVASILAYLDGLATQLAESADDADEIRNIADRVAATKEQIVARIVANTPSEPQAPETPSDAPVIE